MARVRLNRAQIDITARRFGRGLVSHVTRQVESGARALIPIGIHRSGSGAPSPGITLLSSVYSQVDSNPNSVRGRVGTTADHSATIHQGSKPHVIRGRGAKMLKFRWDRGNFLIAARAGRRGGNKRTSRFHYFVKVRHPGNKRPVRYLTTPLHQFGRMNGFRVTTSGVSRTRLP